MDAATQTALTFDAGAVVTFSVGAAGAATPATPHVGTASPPTPLRAPAGAATTPPMFQTPSRRTAGPADASSGLPTVSPITPAFGVDSAPRGGSLRVRRRDRAGRRRRRAATALP